MARDLGAVALCLSLLACRPAPPAPAAEVTPAAPTVPPSGGAPVPPANDAETGEPDAGAPAGDLEQAEASGSAAGLSADQVAKRVAQMVQLLGAARVEVVKAVRGPVMHEITYVAERGDKQRAPPTTVWVTHDGRYLTAALVDIRTRTARLEADRVWATCLANAGLRVYLDMTQEASRKQLRVLGAFGGRVVVDCSGEHAERCKQAGHSAYPAAVWPTGADQELHDEAWLSATLQCPKPVVQPAPAPTKVDAATVAGAVETMHSAASAEAVDALSTTRKGEVYAVYLARRSPPALYRTELVTRDGLQLLLDPVDLPARIEELNDRRRFAGCLRREGIRIFVDSRDRASMSQVAMFGPWAGLLAVDCGRDEGKDVCAKEKIKKVPVIANPHRRLEGLQTRAALESFSGCK